MHRIYRSPHGSPLYHIILVAVLIVLAVIGTAFIYWLAVLTDVALAHPIGFNIIYTMTMLGVLPCLVVQTGGWLSKESPEDSPLNDLFWHCGPLALAALLCLLYLRADYLQSFH